VGGRVHQLALKESTLAGRIDPTGSTARWNWDLSFSNGPQGDREARCQVHLPPGGVLSGAVLWVEGKPRQALIASRGKARTAYEQAVKVEKRDPLLVTTSGPDRLLVQCFPVPSNGTIHIQLNITSPLIRDETQRALVKAPAILERNFSIDCNHLLALTGPPTGLPAEVSDKGLNSPGLAGRVEHSPAPEVFCADPARGFTLAQWSPPPLAPGPLWVVLDGSSSMQAYRQPIAAALRKFRSPQPVGVLLAGDEVVTLLPLGPAEPARLEQAARALEAAPLVGGQNDVAALMMAKEGRVVWVHDGQALQVDTSPLRARADSIVALACSAAPNRLIDELRCREAVRSGPLSDDLVRQMEVVSGQRPDWLQLKLTRVGTKPKQLFTPVEDLSRLWALGECSRLGPSDDALQLAVAYGLVTPISGAVVLESEEQEKRMGLRPSDGSDIPVVPEPATWLLLLVLGALVMGRRQLRH
ncbi:PEP-CTERM sorting domain-containing protein, partial [bacterium]|nr:PEP-CTERM sorting domain-containing protein [bacterium]